jgi:hypothetical protein
MLRQRQCDVYPRPHCDNITATKLAVDRQIEHGKVASTTFDLKFRPDRPDMFGAQRGFAPATLPLLQGVLLEIVLT